MISMKKTTALVLSALLALSGCAKNPDDALTPVTLNEVAHSIFYAPMYVAMEKNYFEKEGIDLSLVTGFGVSQLIQDDFDYPTYVFPPYLAAIQPDGICIQISLLIILHSK